MPSEEFNTSGSVPVPDPTKLTTDAVNAATRQWRLDLDATKELLNSRLNQVEIAITREVLAAADQRLKDIAALRELQDARMDALETLIDLNAKNVADIHNDTKERISHLQNLHEEKFASIAQQFVERDVRTTQASGAADDALKAALQAAKELVGAQGEASAAAAVKSETSFTKQIDQIGTIIQTLEKALDARITELKERIDRGEGTVSGKAETRTNQRADSTLRVAIIGLFITILVVGINLVIYLH